MLLGLALTACGGGSPSLGGGDDNFLLPTDGLPTLAAAQVACPDGISSAPTLADCPPVTCLPGETMQDGICVPDTVPDCPVGETRQGDGTCGTDTPEPCPAGQIRQGDGTCGIPPVDPGTGGPTDPTTCRDGNPAPAGGCPTRAAGPVQVFQDALTGVISLLGAPFADETALSGGGQLLATVSAGAVPTIYGFYSADDDREWLAFGAFADESQRGGFASGATFSDALPTTGSATYIGDGVIRIGDELRALRPDAFLARSEFTAEFGGDSATTLSGKLTEVDDIFVLDFAESTYNPAADAATVRFSGAVTCGGGACLYENGGVGSYTANFFGIADSTVGGAGYPTRLGGAFSASGLSLGGRNAVTVVGGFGGYLPNALRCTVNGCLDSALFSPRLAVKVNRAGGIVTFSGGEFPGDGNISNLNTQFQHNFDIGTSGLFDAVPLTFGFYDLGDDDDYLFFAAWASATPSFRGAAAIGAGFSAAEIAALPTTGQARYRGKGVIRLGSSTAAAAADNKESYEMDSQFRVDFLRTGLHQLRGRLTEVDSLFALDFGDSFFADGEFSGGAVTCIPGIGECEYESGGSGSYNARFFGVTNTDSDDGLEAAASKLGGTFSATGLSLNEQEATNVVGAFGAELFLPLVPGLACEGVAVTRTVAADGCRVAFLPTLPTVSFQCFEGSGPSPVFGDGTCVFIRVTQQGLANGESGIQWEHDNSTPFYIGGSAAGPAFDRASGGGGYDVTTQDDFLLFGAWMTTVALELGAFAIGAEFSAANIAALPSTGEATYSGVGAVVVRGASGPAVYLANSEFIATFGGDGERALQGKLTEDRGRFNLNFEESSYRNGEFSGGAVTCGGGACRYVGGGAGFYNANFFGLANTVSANGLLGAATKLGGTFSAIGLSLDGSPAGNVVGGFGGRLQGPSSSLLCTASSCVDSYRASRLDSTQPTVRRVVVSPSAGRIEWRGGNENSNQEYTADEANILIRTRFRLNVNTNLTVATWANWQSADATDDDEYLIYGAWTSGININDHAGFAIGATFSDAAIAALPATGTATYTGGGGLFVGPNAEDYYALRSRLNVVFGGEGRHRLSGTLTEITVTRTGDEDAGFALAPQNSTPKFVLDLGESIYADGEFSDGAVTCGEGGLCEYEGAGAGLYNARFFGTADSSNGNAATKLGGTFSARGLSLDGKDAANVFGGFGGGLNSYTLPRPDRPTALCGGSGTATGNVPDVSFNFCIDSFLTVPVSLAYELTDFGGPADTDVLIRKTGGGVFSIGYPFVASLNSVGNFPRPTHPLGAAGDRDGVRRYYAVIDAPLTDNFLTYGAWARVSGGVLSNTEKGGFAFGAEFSAAEIAALPTTGSAKYRGLAAIVSQTNPGNGLYTADARFNVVFNSGGSHLLSGSLTEEAERFGLDFGESTFANGEFSGGAVTCVAGIGQCEYEEGGDGFYNARFFGVTNTVAATGPLAAASKLGGTFTATGLSLDGKDATNVAGGFGSELFLPKVAGAAACDGENGCLDSFSSELVTVSYANAGSNGLVTFQGGEFSGDGNISSLENQFEDNFEIGSGLDLVPITFGFYDLNDDENYLFFGVWASATPSFRGGYAIGRDFADARLNLLPAGSAAYNGKGAVRIGSANSYEMNAEFSVNFAGGGGDISLRGILSEVSDLFALELQESVYTNGEFFGGVVCVAGIGNCRYVRGGDDSGFYNADFFGQGNILPADGRPGSPTKLGGTFTATGLSLDGKLAANVVGGFGGTLRIFGEAATTSVVSSFLPDGATVTWRRPAGDKALTQKSGGAGYSQILEATTTGNAALATLLVDNTVAVVQRFSGLDTADDYFYYGAWRHSTEAADRGGFAVGAAYTADLPAAGTATYLGDGAIYGETGEAIFVRTAMAVGFSGGGATFSGELASTNPDDALFFSLLLEESTLTGGRFSGAVVCGEDLDGNCYYNVGGSGEYEAGFFGLANTDSDNGLTGAASNLGGAFTATGLSLSGNDAGRFVGGFGAQLFLTPAVLTAVDACTATVCIDSFLDTRPTARVDGEGADSRVVVENGADTIIDDILATEDRIKTLTEGDFVFSYGNHDGRQIAERVVYGVWGHTTDVANRGAFAVGAEFSADLPVAGAAEYRGRGVVAVSGSRDDIYFMNSMFTATFDDGDAHTLSGTLTETADKFVLNFEESTYADGEFSGEVDCGGGACEYFLGGSGFYNANFFGTANAMTAAVVGAATKLGGTFKASGLLLDGKGPANVAGAFGGELFGPMKECAGAQIPIADSCLDFSVAVPTRDNVAALNVSVIGTLGEADYLAFGVWAEPALGTNIEPGDAFFHAAGGPFPLDNLPTTGGRATYAGAWRALVGDKAQTGFAQFTAFWGNVAAGNPGARVQLNGFSGINGEDIAQGNDAFGNNSVTATDGRFVIPIRCASASCYTNDGATAVGTFYNGGVNTPETEPGHFGGTFDVMVGTTAEDAKRTIGAFGTALQP